MKIYLYGVGLYALLLSACLPITAQSQFPKNTIIKGQALYQRLYQDSALYIHPDSILKLRVVGLRALSPCLLQTPTWDVSKGDSNLILSWPIQGSLDAACSFPAIARDTVIQMPTPKESPILYKLWSYQKTSDTNQPYIWAVSDSFWVQKGQNTYTELSFQIDSAGHVLNLPSEYRLIKSPLYYPKSVWQIDLRSRCEVNDQISCSSEWDTDSVYSIRKAVDTTKIDTLVRILSSYCKVNGKTQCLANTQLDTLNRILNPKAIYQFVPILLDQKGNCNVYQKPPQFSSSFISDTKTRRLSTPQKNMIKYWAYELAANCPTHSSHGIRLDSAQIIPSDSVVSWWK